MKSYNLLVYISTFPIMWLKPWMLLFSFLQTMPAAWKLLQARISVRCTNSLFTSPSTENELTPNWDLIDVDLLKRTIAEWSREMPKEYVTMPLILAGPSGVGEQ